MPTLRAQIDKVLAATPAVTGAQIHARMACAVRAVVLHRYLWNARTRGYISARRPSGVWVYAPAAHDWIERSAVLGWKRAA